MLAQHPHDITLPTFSKPQVKISVTEKSSPKELAQKWLNKFASVLGSGDASRLSSVVHTDSWWRDFLTLTWDFRTVRGVQKMTDFLSQNIGAGITNLKLQESGQFAPKLEHPIEGLEWVESMFHFETKVGKGKGFLRLAQGDDGAWKAHFISTSLQELNNHEEIAGARRAHGGNNSLVGGTAAGNWLDRWEKLKEFAHEEPTVFVVGAGMSSLSLTRLINADVTKGNRVSMSPHVSRLWVSLALLSTKMTALETTGAIVTVHSSPMIRFNIHTCPSCLFPPTGLSSPPKTSSVIGSRRMHPAWSSTSGSQLL
jgi:hypothetical protein